MVSYGDRPNDYDSVSKCESVVCLLHPVSPLNLSSAFPLDFIRKFGAIHHSYTPNKERDLYRKWDFRTPTSITLLRHGADTVPL